MIKAVFVDFYGTVVYEDGEVIKRVNKKFLLPEKRRTHRK